MKNTQARGRFWTPVLLAATGGLLAGLLWAGAWAPPRAYAQVPDSGAQRNEMIKELRKANAQLAEITGLLREIRDETRAARKEHARPGTGPKRP